jgi:hypothetical protein
MTGRSCFAIEIDPAYVDVAVLRWQAFIRAHEGGTSGYEGCWRTAWQPAQPGSCRLAW